MATSSFFEVGIDTNGGGGHGFSLTSSLGSGYVEYSWTALVRARFTGSGVPVELTAFSVE